MRKLLYYRQDEEPDTAGNNPSENAGYFSAQLSLLDKHLRDGNAALAFSILDPLLREICFTEDGIQAALKWCSTIFDILIQHSVYMTSAENAGDYQSLYRSLSEFRVPSELYTFMLREVTRLKKTIVQQQNSRQHQLVRRVREYIHQNFSDSDLSVVRIAESAGISDSYLSSIFVEYTGETLISYLNNYRVNVAKDLLTNTQIIIKEIGFRTGFNTIQNFNRVFKKATGMTPGDYRKQKAGA